MADISSELPIRSQLPGQVNYDDIIIKVGDATNPATQQASVDTHGSLQSRIADASGNVVTSQANGGQRSLDTRDQSAGPVTPGTAANFAMLMAGQFNTSLPTLTAAQQSALQLTSKGELITIMDIGGLPISTTNPVPVFLSSAPIGNAINNYNTVAAVAASATSNHTYTITSGKTFQGKKIWASASGLMKIEVQVSPDGSTYSTLWVGFNSTANPNITVDLDEMVFLESGTGSTIRIIRTNEDKKAMDLYSTISGTEV